MKMENVYCCREIKILCGRVSSVGSVFKISKIVIIKTYKAALTLDQITLAQP